MNCLLEYKKARKYFTTRCIYKQAAKEIDMKELNISTRVNLAQTLHNFHVHGPRSRKWGGEKVD